MHIPRKRFGQNFLVDNAIIAACVSAINPLHDDVMAEIGPGLGALTQPLLQRLDHLHVIEIDRDIIAWMKGHYPLGKLTIHECDALKFDFNQVPTSTGRMRVVGNLPYNISTPLLFHLLDNATTIIDMHFMLQKEVVERMVAKPSTADYGRLSVMLQYRLHMDHLFTVPPDAFDPAPKVESAFVRAIPYAELPAVAKDEMLFAKIVTAAFGQRRKTLRNTLKGMLGDQGFSELGIDSNARAENLSVEEFVAIANYLAG